MTDWAALYAATTYRVFLPEGIFNLRIGRPDDGLSAWLSEQGAQSYAIVTAWNPQSERVSDARNAEQQSAMTCDLLEAGYEPMAAENAPDTADWPIEESCFVPDITLADAAELADIYGQRAFVFGAVDQAPTLVWVADCLEADGDE